MSEKEIAVSEKEIGIKDSAEKLSWSLLPWRELKQLVELLNRGAKKYSAENWKYVEPFDKEYFDAMMRHIDARQCGEIMDPETKVPHYIAVACNALFLAWKDNEDAKNGI